MTPAEKPHRRIRVTLGFTAVIVLFFFYILLIGAQHV